MPNSVSPNTCKGEVANQSDRFGSLFAPKFLFFVITILALGGIGSGYILQLNSRLALAESELRLLRVNHQLLTQELVMEKMLHSPGNLEHDQLSQLEIIPLHAAPSSWQLNVNFQVLWNPRIQQGILILDGEIEDASSYQLGFKVLTETAATGPVTTTIATGPVPSDPRRRWFELPDEAPATLVGFELVMQLSIAPADTIIFSGNLSND